MEYRLTSCLSLPRLDVGRPGHLAPLLGFVGDDLAELGRRTAKDAATEIGDAPFHLGIAQCGIDLLVEPVDDVCGRVSWRSDAIPRAGLETRQELAHRRELG